MENENWRNYVSYWSTITNYVDSKTTATMWWSKSWQGSTGVTREKTCPKIKYKKKQEGIYLAVLDRAPVNIVILIYFKYF